MGALRVFLAVGLDDDTTHRLAHVVERAIPGGLPGRTVDPVSWHLTLRFVGGVDDAAIDRIVHAVDSADLGEVFPMRLGGLGAFPTARRASVLWVGVDVGAAELERLAATVDDAVDRAGFGAEDRPFRPHLTLSRMRPDEDVRDLIESVDPIEAKTRVSSVTLYRTHLRRGGARYEALEHFPLG